MIAGRPGRLAVPPRPRGPAGPARCWSSARRPLGACRRVVRPLIVRFADLDIALRIEERWPGLNDRLASTIQFLRLDPGDDDRYGSPALREATVEQAIEETESIDFREVIEYRPILRAAGLAAAAAGDRGLADRLVAPGLDPDRPAAAVRPLRRRPLAAADPPGARRQGDDAQDRARRLVHARRSRSGPGDRIPDSAGVTYRFADGERSTEPLRAIEGGEFRGRIETVNQPFKFSVAGGDDTQLDPRRRGQGRPAPGAQPADASGWSRPPYTGIPAQTLAAGPDLVPGARRDPDRARGRRPTSRSPRPSSTSATQPAAGAASTSTRPGPASRPRFAVKDNVTLLVRAQGHRGVPEPRVGALRRPDVQGRSPAGRHRRAQDRPRRAGRRHVPVRIELDDDFGIHSARLIYKVATGDSEPHEAVAIPLWSAPSGEGPATGSSPSLDASTRRSTTTGTSRR